MNERSLRCGESARAPAAIKSARAVFPDPLAPMTATNPEFKFIGFCANQLAFVTVILLIVLPARAPRGCSGPM